MDKDQFKALVKEGAELLKEVKANQKCKHLTKDEEFILTSQLIAMTGVNKVTAIEALESQNWSLERAKEWLRWKGIKQ